MKAPINDVSFTFVGSKNALQGLPQVFSACLGELPEEDKPVLSFVPIETLGELTLDSKTVIGSLYSINGGNISGVDAVTRFIREATRSQVPVIIQGLRSKHENDEIKLGKLPNCADIIHIARDLPKAIRLVLGLPTE